MHVLEGREAALTAAGMQCANATLLQHFSQKLLRSGITARTRQALVITLLSHMSVCGGRLSEEAAGNKAAMCVYKLGRGNRNVMQQERNEF